MPRLVEIRKNGAHVGLLSTQDDQLIEVLTALLHTHGTYSVKVLSKAERPPETIPFLRQFDKTDFEI